MSSFFREKNSTGFSLAKFGFIPKGAIGQTCGFSYQPEAQ